jgi:hypothetical protein
MTTAGFASLILLVSACATPSGDDNFADDCKTGGCAKLSLRWSVDRGGKDSTCAAVDGAMVDVIATYQADNRTAHFTASCSAGAALSENMPLGPYRLDVVLEGADGSPLSTKSATATLAAPNVITETTVAFDVKPKAVPGGEFGTCSATMPCHDATNTCVLDGAGNGFCSPPCTGACEQLAPYLSSDAHPTAFCVAYDNTPNSPQVCVIFCSTNADCATGMTCKPANQNDPPHCG